MSGSAPTTTAGYALTARGREALRSGAVRQPGRDLLECLEAGSRSEAELRRRGDRGGETLRELLRDGLLAPTSVERRPRARERTVRRVALAPGLDVEACVTGALARAPRQAALLRELAAAGPLDAPILATRIPGAAGALRALTVRRPHGSPTHR